MADTLRILLLPLHRWVSNRWGTELGWAFNLAYSLAGTPELDVTAIVGNIDPEDKSILETRLRVESLGLSRMDSTAPSVVLSHARFYWSLLARGGPLLRSLRPDVVHHVFPMGLGTGQNPCFLLSGDGAPRVIGPLLHPPRGEDVEGLGQALSPAGIPSLGVARSVLSPLIRRAHLVVLKKASWLLYDSPETLSLAQNMMPKVSRIPSSILATGGLELPDILPVRRGSGLRLGVLHHLRPRKRIDLLLRALAGTDSNISLVIGGDGPEEPRLRLICTQLGLDERVEFAGMIPPRRRMAFWESVDVVATMDEFPPLALSTVQEAMAAGRAFIASGPPAAAYAELPYGIVTGCVGLDGFRRAVHLLASDPALKVRMGIVARSYASEHFAREAVRQHLCHVYATILGLSN